MPQLGTCLRDTTHRWYRHPHLPSAAIAATLTGITHRMTTMSDRSIDPVARVQALAPLIREHADANERQRHLSNEVAFELARNGLYRIAAPPRCGGEAVDPMTQIATIEAAATLDGSTAWNLMIGIESFGLIAPNFEHCAELLEDPLAILCGSTAAVGTADEIDGGFRINGRWQFVSGCHNSRVFAGLVQRRRGGEPIPHVPIVYAVVARPDYKILDTLERRRPLRLRLPRCHDHERRCAQRTHTGAHGRSSARYHHWSAFRS